MSDQQNTTPEPTFEPVVEERPNAADVPVDTVVAQEPKLVGDEDTQVVDHRVDVTQEQVPAQVTQPREGDNDKVNVHEVSVQTDEVITDTSDPRAVQVPDAGRSPLLDAGLPIAALDGERVEDVFAREASKSDES